MRIHTDLADLHAIAHPVLTTGTFDGVHAGHRVILDRLRAVAAQQGGESVLFTFHPHPRLVLQPHDNDLRLLSTVQEKQALLEEAGLDHLIVVPFSQDFSRMQASEYVRKVLVGAIGIHAMVVGYDHRFGRNREGDLGLLQQEGERHGFTVEEIPAQLVDAVKVSSTKVRAALLAGDVDHARELLGYPYPLEGVVVHGDKRGRELGYPTANIHVQDPHKLVPGNGVYIVHVLVEGMRYDGMLNIGVRPAVPGVSGERTVEVHLLDFTGDLYARTLRVELLHRLRDELRFEGLEALVQAMDRDKENTRVWLEQHTR